MNDLINKIDHFYKYYVRPKKCFLPQRAHIEISLMCNLKCPVCPKNQSNFIGAGFLSYDAFKNIYSKIDFIDEFSLMSQGETLLNPDIFKILEFIDMNGKKVSFVTNGTLLNETTIKKLRSVKSIAVSIDSGDPEEFARERKGATLSQVVDNMRLLNKMQPHVKIQINTLLSKYNLNELDKILKIAMEINCREIYLIHLLASTEEMEKDHITYMNDADQKIQEFMQKAKKDGVVVSTKPSQATPMDCAFPWFTPYICSNGDVLSCCFIYSWRYAHDFREEYYYGKKIDINFSDHIMGNIFEESFNEIWNNNAYQQLRMLLREKPENCSNNEEYSYLRTNNLSKKRFKYCKYCAFRYGISC